MEEIKSSSTQPSDKNLSQISHILSLLQFALEDFKGQVVASSELLELDLKTELSLQIEKTIKDPLVGILAMSSDIDNKVKDILDKIVITYFKKNHEILQSVYKSKTASRDLHYSVVLKKDDERSRDQLYSFFDWYNLVENGIKHPINFQVVPAELIGKINTIEEVNLSSVN